MQHQLKSKWVLAFTVFIKETVRKVYEKFRSRLEDMVEANDDFFEWILSIVFQEIFMQFW